MKASTVKLKDDSWPLTQTIKVTHLFHKVKAELEDHVIRFRRFRRITNKTALSHRQGFQRQGRTFNRSSLYKFLWGSWRTLTVCPHLQCNFTSSVHLSVTPTTHRGSRPTSFLKYWELMVLQISKHHLCCTPFLDILPHFLASLQPVIIVAMLQYSQISTFVCLSATLSELTDKGAKTVEKRGPHCRELSFLTHTTTRLCSWKADQITDNW